MHSLSSLLIATLLFLVAVPNVAFANFIVEAQDSIEIQDSAETPDSVVVLEQSLLAVSQESVTYPRVLENPYKFKATELIVPTSLIAVGAIGFSKGWKKNVNEKVEHDLQKNGHHKLSFDDYLTVVPAVAGYGMNLFGFSGTHNVADATIIYGTAYILLGVTTLTLKYSIDSPRPNLKNNHSFPSAHTAIAFCGAELLRREYWSKSPWIGIAGYAVAATTGFMRLYNNAHWLNDVLAGAGLGILCAEAAYWLYPVITKTFFKKRYKANGFLAPAISKSQIGLACSLSF